MSANAKAKPITVVIILAALAAPIIFGWKFRHDSNRKLDVQGTAYRGSYNSMTSNSTASPVEYRVEYTLRNAGRKAIDFDEVVAKFTSAEGGGFTMQTPMSEDLSSGAGSSHEWLTG